MEEAVATAAGRLEREGYAVVDGLLGPTQAAAVAGDFRQFVGALAAAKALAAGELDATGRSAPAVRGDLIYWLSGQELGQKWPTVGAAAQLMAAEVLRHLRGAPGHGLKLLPSKQYAAAAMLAVYPGGSVGFAPHTDRSDLPGDTRAVTAVYYMNPEWKAADGGLLRVEPTPGANGVPAAAVEVEPVLDRLVLFWADQTTHSVQPTTAGVRCSPSPPAQLSTCRRLRCDGHAAHSQWSACRPTGESTAGVVVLVPSGRDRGCGGRGFWAAGAVAARGAHARPGQPIPADQMIGLRGQCQAGALPTEHAAGTGGRVFCCRKILRFDGI